MAVGPNQNMENFCYSSLRPAIANFTEFTMEYELEREGVNSTTTGYGIGKAKEADCPNFRVVTYATTALKPLIRDIRK